MARDVKPVITLTVTNATASDGSKVALTCASRAIAFTAASALSSDAKTMTVTLTPPAGAILAGDNCTLAGDVSTTGAGGTAKTPIDTSFSIYAAPVAVANGLSLVAGTSDSHGSKDGALLDASFNGPTSLAVDALGTVYVADGFGDAFSSPLAKHALYRKISSNGQVMTIAGTSSYYNVGRTNVADSLANVGSDSFGGEATWGLAVQADGTLYSSGMSHLVETISPQGQITSIAGAWSQQGAVDGKGSAARFSGGGIAVDTEGNLFVGDAGNHAIRKIDTSGNVTTYAGLLGANGSTDGALQTARFWYPGYLKFEKSSGKLYVADANGIRVIVNGVVSTLVTKQQIYQDLYHAPASPDSSSTADGLDVAADGRIAVSYSGARRVLIYRDNRLELVLGNGDYGDADGSPLAAKFYFPHGVAFLPNGDLLIADGGNSNIKRYSASTNVISLYAGKRRYFDPIDGSGSAAKLGNAKCMVQSPSGDIWFSQEDRFVRKVDSAGRLNTVLSSTDSACVLKVNPDGSFITSAGYLNELRLFGPTGDFQRTLATNVGAANVSAANANGDLFFAAWGGTIKKFSNGVVSDFATVVDGGAMGIGITDDGELVVANGSGLFKVSLQGAVSSIAPNRPFGKYMDGAVGEVSLGIFGFYPSPVVGRDGAIYIFSSLDSVIRKIYNGRVEKVVGTQWVNETSLGAGPGAIGEARGLKYDAKTNSLIVMTDNAILRAQLP